MTFSAYNLGGRGWYVDKNFLTATVGIRGVSDWSNCTIEPIRPYWMVITTDAYYRGVVVRNHKRVAVRNY